MRIVFNINYHTVWGETLCICGDIAELGNGDSRQALEMKMVNPGLWQLSVDIGTPTAGFNYWFVVKSPDKEWRFEWGRPHRYVAGRGIELCTIFDSWQDRPANMPFYSSAFTSGIFRRPGRTEPLEAKPGTISIRVFAPMIRPDQTLAICGEGDILGNWDPANAIRLNDADFPIWEVRLPLSGMKIPFEYKFIVLDNQGKCLGWEAMNNRIFGIASERPDQQIVIDGTRFVNPLPGWRGAGTAIPVFSLRSNDDFGVGDFLDLMPMVDWCRLTGQNILQILPINDTTLTGTWIDSYPYRANSTFALHPLYIRPSEVGRLNNPERRTYYEKCRLELNLLPEVDYEAVSKLKEQYLREIFAQDYGKLAESVEYCDFVTRNEYWLKPYAAWRVLRDEFHTADHRKWKEMSVYAADRIEDFAASRRVQMDYYYFVQFHLDRQLHQAREYAHANGVVLKGDIPIGIGRESVDAWQAPELFNMNTSAGAPPDDFSVLGQNWGFPTYDWDRMSWDGFAWWKNRFRKMAEYFDAYRIDHILGFFRIWQIPLDAVHGLLGYFNPALPMSPQEMLEKYDFWFDAEQMVNPLIRTWMLDDLFGPYKDDAVNTFLDRAGYDSYRLCEFVGTQAKVEVYFAGKPDDDRHRRLRDAMLGIIDDVLFIEDPYKKGHYHPRITARTTGQYRILPDGAKRNFDRLYDDFFYHRHNDFWYGKAMWKLPPLIDATGMLACGEDLGMIPDCVPSVMSQLHILSLEIQRMPKEPGREFGDTESYPYYSVCTTSTHYMEGIRQWWEEDHDRAARYYHEVLGLKGDVPMIATPDICRRIVGLHLKSPSMLCILPLQDWMAVDPLVRRVDCREERINVPANPRNYWNYRMHLSVENLLGRTEFNAAVAEMIAGAGR